MYHSITFTNESTGTTKNTWDDFHLIPSSRPFVAPPPVNEKLIEVPGRSGMLDLTDALTSSRTFGNRTGSWEFYVMHDLWSRGWAYAYTVVQHYIHGRRLKVVLEDDPDYYYEGRISVTGWASPKDYSKITISYSLDPYKIEASTGSKRL